MPLGEFIGEVVLRPLLEIVLYGLTYWIGYIFLSIGSFGTIRMAPFHTLQEKNRDKKKWYQIDWSIWLHRPMQKRVLKADCVCLVGLLVLAIAGVCVYVTML